MMERRLSLPSLPLLDPVITLKKPSLLKLAKKGTAATPADRSQEKRFLWKREKAVSFDLSNNQEHESNRFQGLVFHRISPGVKTLGYHNCSCRQLTPINSFSSFFYI